jgi:hypothetical protein
MRKSGFAKVVFGAFAVAAWVSGPVSLAVAHEAHNAKCTETGINAMNADIQSMDDGEAKTTATEEMQRAEDMMANKDLKGCAAHMHNAMEAMEK